MALELEDKQVFFKNGYDTITETISFSNTVSQANVGLRGFDLEYGDDSHKIRYDSITLSCSWSGNSVTFSVSMKVGASDTNEMSGSVDVLIIAETT